MSNKKNDYDLEQVTLELDDGSEMTCDVLAIFPVNIKNEQKMYIALLDEEADEDTEIFLYGVGNLDNPDDIELIDIEDDDEFEAVQDAFDELLDEAEFNEMFEDDED